MATPRARTRWSALAASALIQCCAGSSYCFGVYSPALKASQRYDQSALDAVAFFKDIGANAGVLSGFLAAWAPAGRRRPWLVLLAGALLCAAGYIPMWLAVAGIAHAPLPLMCAYMLLAAQAQTFFNTADVVCAVENFPDRRGTVIGIMKGFLGLSGAILVQIYRTLHIDPTAFILMLAILPTTMTVMLMSFVDVHSTHERYNKKFLDAFSLIAVTVAVYLMIIIICDQVFMISSAAQTVCFVILLLLALSPVAVAVKAQKLESIQHEEPTSSEQRIGLLREEVAEGSESASSSTALLGSNQDLSAGKENLNVLQAMGKLNFWLLFLAMACGMGSGLATVNNISQIGGSLGYTNKETSTLVSLWSIWNFSGRFGAGFISDHFLRLRGVGRPFFIGATLLIMSVGHGIISSGLPASLYIGSVLVGLCYGCQWALMPSITSEIFGLNHFGTIFNMVAVASPVGSYILSVRVVGYIYDMESTPHEHGCQVAVPIQPNPDGGEHRVDCSVCLHSALHPGASERQGRSIPSLLRRQAMEMRPSAAICALLLSLLPACLAFPLCTDAKAPVLLNTTLKFCASSAPANSSSCCDAAADAALSAQFDEMKVSDAACAALLKSILCAKCSPYSADLFDAGPKIRTIPFLCNSTSSATSAQSKETTQDYCKLVWETCKDVKITNSPFQPPLQGSAPPPSSSSKLTDAWQSENDFCTSFGGAPSDQSVCFSGNTVSFNATQPSPSPKGICLERIGDGSYLNMAPHPDGSNRVFLGSQAGKIWLATVPEQGSGGSLQFEEASPFVDLTDQVHFDSAFGLMGMAFHPDFATNGRFFASYNCDRTKSPSCTGRCSCNSDVGCDPTKLGTDNGAQPCQYQVVVSEYSAKGSSANVSEATSADPSEVRRIFTMGLPYTSQHGGQVLFGPDGYLYLMMGDGGGKGDPFNFAQNKKSLLGKIMRLDIDNTPRASEISNTSLWGNYSIPKDNPYADDSELQPEIWALGLRNPWRCSFDSERPSYFYCGDVGQDQYEEVDLISKGGNYGWRALEGPLVYHPAWAPGGNTSLDSINAIPPIMGYSHSDVNKNIGSASIMGGYVYRGSADPCLYGRYLYGDLYASAMWTGTETPESSGNYTSNLIPFSCSKDSPIPCDTAAGSPLPSLGYVYSFGEDNSKDIYVLASKGVYRVVRPSLCSYTCPTEKPATKNGTTPAGPSSKAPATALGNQMGVLLLSIIMFWVLMR